METLNELFQLIVALWNTGNRIIRTAIIILIAWPAIVIFAALTLTSSALTAIAAMIPIIGILLLWVSSKDPLIIGVIAATKKGRVGIQWLFGAFGVELLFGAYCSYVPVENSPKLLPLTILLILTILFLSLGFSGKKWAVKTIKILFLLLVATTISFFLPNKTQEIKGAVKKFDTNSIPPMETQAANQPNIPNSCQLKLGQRWQQVTLPPHFWGRLDAIGQPVHIRLIDDREFMQYPGKNPQPILDKAGKLGPEGGIGNEIPGLRIFVKSGNPKEDAKLEITVWRKT